MPTKELENYRQFTKPAELHKAVNTLRGLVAGINSDMEVGSSEVTELVHWCELHADLRDRHPFSEILPVVERATEDGVVTEDEAKDILWLCNNFADNNSYYNMITSSIQFLSGMLHGLMADGELSDREILALKSWMDANQFLAGTYPFDEINSLLYVILEDKRITQRERETLMVLFGGVIDFTSSYNLSEKEFSRLREQYSIGGICAVCPEISFEGKTFCFTGEFYRAKRAEIAQLVTQLGGTVRTSVSAKTDYLVVGNAGNPCWAYACYGRKIEQAVSLRKEGAEIVIVNETDFWDTVDDMDITPTIERT
ncbi:BRCT domain-containing protein [Pseudoflavonifractor phocaeensis]|uniref:BRCT domain-containing protein n=1 Tax=Pseudoflavonifractor phocaeensis TaxID=1870988 RepID=UPI00195677CA|nr:BRCT domain-containing protein [Pseudoflavonifractor phocaeensis]MBM6926931.1 BRCT domain-containing protein [Pseudoflavonifractor phocaeensis]